MSKLTVVTKIPADIERAFLLATDIGLHQQSLDSTHERAVAGVTSGNIKLGEHVQWRAKHFGVWWKLTSKITDMQEPLHFQDEQTSGPFKYFRHRHTFDQRDGYTKMTDEVHLSAPFLGFVVDPIVLVPYMKRLLTRRGEALALMCRGSETDTP